MSVNGSISYILTRLVTLFVLLAGTWFVLQGQLTAGGFIAFVLITNVLFRPIDKINTVIEMYPKGIAGFKSYVDLLETEPDVKDTEGARDLYGLKGEIEYRDVTFGYDEHSHVLKDINLKIKQGKLLRLSGLQERGNRPFAVCCLVL